MRYRIGSVSVRVAGGVRSKALPQRGELLSVTTDNRPHTSGFPSERRLRMS